MCANLEDTRLDGFFAVGAQFDRTAPLVIFAVRNLYVLGGLVFLGIVAWRTLWEPSGAHTRTRACEAPGRPLLDGSWVANGGNSPGLAPTPRSLGAK